MKRNPIMEKCRELITPDMKRSVDLSVYVSDRIFDILEKQNMSQRDLANKLGKSEAEISKWMQGTQNFTLSTIAKIETALGENIFEIERSKEKEYVFIPIPMNKWTNIRMVTNDTKIIPISNEWNIMGQN
jgi:ribosome-binding protein aMBF1 (putative translation factor)